MMASWYTAISPPRRFAGEISAMYSGESIEAMPMPVPPTNRATTRCHGAVGIADPMAQSVNSTADRSSTFLRPKRSLNVPAIAEPIKHPISAELTIHPVINFDSWNWSLQLIDGPGDHGRVEAEQQAAERRHTAGQGQVQTASPVLVHESFLVHQQFPLPEPGSIPTRPIYTTRRRRSIEGISTFFCGKLGDVGC